jgi:hypothetical protein
MTNCSKWDSRGDEHSNHYTRTAVYAIHNMNVVLLLYNESSAGGDRNKQYSTTTDIMLL